MSKSKKFTDKLNGYDEGYNIIKAMVKDMAEKWPQYITLMEAGKDSKSPPPFTFGIMMLPPPQQTGENSEAGENGQLDTMQ